MEQPRKLSAQEVRGAIERVDPVLLSVAEELRDRFGARFIACELQTPEGPVEIGNVAAWREQQADSHPWVKVTNDRTDAKEEWKRIKAEALEAGDRARRKPSLAGRAAVVRGAQVP